MSRKKESILFFKDVLDYLRRKWVKVTVGGEQLSPQDSSLVHEVFALNAMLWLDVTERELNTKRKLLTWVTHWCTATLDEILDVYEWVDAALISGEYHSTDHLRGDLHQIFPNGWRLIAPLKLQLDGFFEEYRLGQATRLQDIRSCLLFTSRLTLSSYSKAREESYEKFEATMDRISKVKTLPTEYMCNWVSTLYPASESAFLERFLPRHGNGAVAEKGKRGRLTQLEKFSLSNTPAVRYLLNKCGIMPLPIRSLSETNRVSRLTDVPKGIRKRRIVCPEPAALMFLQQGVARCLDFRFTPLRKHVDLLNASLSADLAREGSITGKFCTIDLSSASDSVRWDFVYALFSKRTYLQRLMTLCRSTKRKYPDGHISENHHFAPMGSALCFPVEVITFCAIAEQAIHNIGGQSRYRIYGDDIVIEEKYYEEMIRLLILYGFEPNLDKTFHGDQPFREACGGHYFLGFDVTPMRLSRSYAGLFKRNPKCVAGQIDLANRTFGRFAHCHDVVSHYVMQNTNYNISCTTNQDDTSKFLTNVVHPTIDVFTDRKKGRGTWFQYPERKTLVLQEFKDQSLRQATDELKYWVCLNQLERGSSQDDTYVSNDRPDSRFVLKWTPCL